MDRHDGLAGSRRTGHARRPREGTLDQRPLGRVKEDAPFLPRKGERLFQFLLVGDEPDPPQRIGMREGIGDRRGRRGRHQPAGRGVFQQSFGGFGRQVGGQCEEAVFARRANIGQPVGGHADREQRIVVQARKQRRRGCRFFLALSGLGKDEIECRRRGDFLHTLAHLDDLDGAGSRMSLDPPAFRPGIGVVVVADISDQQAVARLVNDQTNVAIDARRPEIGVLAVVDAVQLETVAGRVHLKSKTLAFTAFWSGLDRRLNEAVKVSAMRKFTVQPSQECQERLSRKSLSERPDFVSFHKDGPLALPSLITPAALLLLEKT